MSARGLLPHRLSRGLLVSLVAGFIGICLGGVAHAYWSSGGSGQGSGATTTAAAIVVSAGTPGTALYPGGNANVTLTVSNPNAFSVHFSSLALDVGRGTGGFTVDAGHSGCGVSALSFPTQTNAGAGWSVPATVGAVDGNLSITLVNALLMDLGAADACQGAAFTVALAAGS